MVRLVRFATIIRICLVCADSSTGCRQHDLLSLCVIFRNQHGCVWDVSRRICVPDTPCERRSRQQCEFELTTGDAASWDATTNKCFWDEAKALCRWSDECSDHDLPGLCEAAGCSWMAMCTPVDMALHPGPGICRETCSVPSNTRTEKLNSSSAPSKGHRQGVKESTPRAPSANSTVVQTSNGLVQGTDLGPALEFLGIPFAQAPVGDLRWAPPKAVPVWNDVFRATTYGPACSQDQGYYFADRRMSQGFSRAAGDLGYSEDCLNLNVWTPSASGSRAVMVWIHGGCFVSGSASSPEYVGASLAAQRDVVVVTVQYRLGVFGWLADPALRSRDPGGSTGNYGLMDNVAALQWVQKNIAAFGGDPNRVTIFGESSGAGSVSQLLGVQAAWPYFHRGIMESGTGSFWTYITMEAAHTNYDKVLAATDCASTDPVACLLAAPSGNLSAAVSSVPCRDGCTWAPVIDGVYLTGRPIELARSGQLRPNTSLIAGFNLNDGALFVPDWPVSMGIMSLSSLTSYYSQRFGGERVSTLFKAFPVPSATSPAWLSDYFYAAQNCETSFSYACSAQWVASAASHWGLKTYVYQFSEPTTAGLVLHSDEIRYVFGNLIFPSPQKAAVSSMVMDYWANFAKTGDPNSKGLPSWPSWSPAASLLNISATPTVAHVPKDAFIGCAFFDAHWDFYGGCLPTSALQTGAAHASPTASASSTPAPSRSVEPPVVEEIVLA